jgi:hypothetical protein
MRRFPLLVLAALLLSGCGVLTKQELKPVPKTLTHGRFVYLADRVCRRDIRRAKRAFRTPPKNHVEYDKKLNAALKGYDQVVFDLRALAPPAAQAESYRRLLAAYNYQDLLLHNLLEAGDSGRLTKVKAVLRKLEINGVSLKSRAYDLDLKTCAKA